MSFSLALRLARHLSTSAAASKSPSSITVGKARSKLKSEYNPDKALKIYSSIGSDNTSPVTSRYAQEYTVRVLARSKRFSDIEKLIDSHKSRPEITQEPFVCTLIRSYGLAGMFDNALSIFNQMDELGTPRTVASFNTLLLAAVLSKKFERVPQLFHEMSKWYKIKPDNVSYGVLIKAYCEMGNTDVAMETLKEMEKKVAEVSVVTYTSIIYSLYKAGKIEEAEKVWNEMVNKGCTPDVGAYNVKLVNIQKPEEVLKVIEEMKNAGLKLNTLTYNNLITCYCINGMFEEAMKVCKEMVGNGCKTNVATYRLLVFHLCQSGKFETANKVFRKSVKARKFLDFNTLKPLVEGLAKCSDTNKLAKEVILTVRKKFPPEAVKDWDNIEDELGLGSSE